MIIIPIPARLGATLLALLTVTGVLRAQTPPPVVPNATLTPDQLASRFLAQATFGPSPAAIAELRQLNYDYRAWIAAELAKPPTYALPLLRAAVAARHITAWPLADHNRRARNEVMLTGRDALRQRVAYALSQIFVISDQAMTIQAGGEGSTAYYDMLLQHAFGNYRHLLLSVARHPMMGHYLSHYRNRVGDPVTGRRPDENFAREIMQLFSIGLYQLNRDGSIQHDASGRPIETYTNDHITEFARVFTGFTDEDNNPNSVGTWPVGTGFPAMARPNTSQPMEMWEPQHDRGEKRLLHYPGATKPVLPAGQSGLKDVADAVGNLVEHPNTPPFIARLLIQRLVTSNPSAGYIDRVASAFIDNGRGERGDLGHVVTAILLDREARDPAFILDPEHGKLREPFLRVAHLMRALNYRVTPGVLPHAFSYQFNEGSLGQYPLSAPSVFNFYLPDFQPAGPIGDAGLFAPEFQIHTAVYGIGTPNVFSGLLQDMYVNVRLDLTAAAERGGDPAALVDYIDLLLTHGTMSAATRETLLTAIRGVTPALYGPPNQSIALNRARLALYLAAISPDFAVLK